MKVPLILNFLNTYEIPSIWVFIILGILFWLFVIWYESLKDGFDADRMFDIAFWSGLAFFGSYKILQNIYTQKEIFDPTSWLTLIDKMLITILLPYLTSFIPVLFFSRYFKWSKYRLLDIFSIASLAFVMSVSFGLILLYSQKILILGLIFLFSLYIVLLRYRSYKFPSGFIFSFIFIAISVVGFAFYRNKGYLYFYSLLITIGLLNIYIRSKDLMMINKKLPADIIDSFKKILIKKDSDLKNEQEKLKTEDAFLKEGRDTDNAEELDEVMLEDVQKEITDLRMDVLTSMRIQVRKALAAIHVGKYGVCESCGNPIDKARLEIYPQATKCFDCASREQ